MSRRWLVSAFALTLVAATTAFRAPSMFKWPPWISIESPVNPYDPAAQGAVMLVHVTFREGTAQLTDLRGSAEGLVGGARRSIPLRFEDTGRANTFALRKQWPSDGAWMLRLVVRQTTALVTLDRAGNVLSARVPTARSGHDELPRAVEPREIDSTLVASAGR